MCKNYESNVFDVLIKFFKILLISINRLTSILKTFVSDGLR